MLEGIIADVLVRVLGSYVDGLNRESIRVGVWRGDLELHNLRLRPDALAILFETLGLDLPVTVTAGHVGLLRLEVPWKTLQSAPVRIFMRDVTVVASPVSDGDQSALELRERRLKSARLATDEAVRDAKFSVRTELSNRSAGTTPNLDSNADSNSTNQQQQQQQQSSGTNRFTRWGWRFTNRLVTRIVDNIQVDVENVIIQHEDSSSVRDKPYTASLAFDSLRACSTDRNWNRVFLESPDSPIVHKVVYARGLVLNWEPGSSNNQLRSWILNSDSSRSAGQWSGLVRDLKRHAIKPMDGELRIALTKNSALASALANKDPSMAELRNTPRVQMDLHFPQVHVALDDFQYHTLLSTIMYLSDIDRKVRPKTARGRWFWALDRLLPRFKERRQAAQRFNAEGLRARREKRERYCHARNIVVKARRGGLTEPAEEAMLLEQLENELLLDDIMLFRDIADRQLDEEQNSTSDALSTSTNSRFWSLFSRGSRQPSSDTPSSQSIEQNLDQSEDINESNSINGNHNSRQVPESTTKSYAQPETPEIDNDNGEVEMSESSENTPNFRMGFLLGRGAIELKEGGFPNEPIPVSSLEFRELRLGIETRPDAGFLLEALLGTFEVVDLQKETKVMYPRAPWAGEKVNELDEVEEDSHTKANDTAKSNESMSQLAEEWIEEKQLGQESTSTSTSDTKNESISPVLKSYPHDISDAIAEIRGEYGIESVNLPLTSPRFSPYRSSITSESSSSVSGLSDGGTSAASPFTREDLSIHVNTPLRYIAALRLNQEEATEGDWASGATRMAMDLAIGGMEVLIDGPKSAFISSVTFWHPREKMPPIMQFLMRAAAPRLASLRMDIQKALLERSVPMRMDLLVRGPRFVIPGSQEHESSLVLDLGTFAMETSTSALDTVTHQSLKEQCPLSEIETGDSELEKEPLSIRYTEYNMAFTDLGVYVVSEAGRQAAERIVRPFSVHLLLEVLHNSSFVETMTLSYKKVDISKVRLRAKLPSLKTSLSHHAFRQILEAAKAWEESSKTTPTASGIEPNPVTNSLTISAEMEQVRHSHTATTNQPITQAHDQICSPLIAFQMLLDFEDLQLELRDSVARRIVTISTIGTQITMTRRPEKIDFDYSVRSFTVVDGSRGATAPFRRLAYAGTSSTYNTARASQVGNPNESGNLPDSRAFIQLSYIGDLVNHEQVLGVKILSLNLVCVREAYFALADFFYLKDGKKGAQDSDEVPDEQSNGNQDMTEKNVKDDEVEYADPFAAVGMTTSGAAQALRQQAGRGVLMSKQAIANRGRMSVTADLDGLNLTLVTAEGAIASFDVSNCKTHLVQDLDGSVAAHGELGGFGIRDLTSAYDVYAETVRYNRSQSAISAPTINEDGWKLKIPQSGNGDIEFHAHLRNIRIVYLHRFIIILKKYFDVLRQSLKPILEMKGGLAEVFDSENGEDFPAIPKLTNRVNVNILTESIDIVMPRHSQSPYEALRFYVPHSSITNMDIAAPGYQIGLQVTADNVDTYVLYQEPAEGEGRALTEGGTEPVLKHITPNSPIEELTPFSTDIAIVAKLDMWRRRRVPQVVLNADGLPVLQDGEEEREYDPAKWLPALRVRVSAPKGISARLCEAEYSILYFTFTENVIERPDIEFTDLVRGLKTPVLPKRRPVQPIMFSSNKMPPNYQILFEVPRMDSVIMSGANPRDDGAALIRTQLTDVVGWFDYGVDYRMTIEVNANLQSLIDVRPGVSSRGKTLITRTIHVEEPNPNKNHSTSSEITRSVTFTWDRPFGFRSNIMVVASDLKIIVEPELFRDLGALTTPGFPFLKSSAPPPLLRFNGRLMIVTISRPEIWVMANQFAGDGRSLVLRGDIIAKVQWAAVTGRQMVEVAANGIHVNLSNIGPSILSITSPSRSPRVSKRPSSLTFPTTTKERDETETPMLYPCDIALRFDGSGYDPPEDADADGQPVKISGSSLSINAESFLIRLDVNDTPLILAVGSRLVRLTPSELSRRPVQPGRFDQWIDNSEDGDAKLAIDFAIPQSRLMFTDETAGRYIPIMEARIRNAVLKSNVPWLTNVALEFGLDLFNDEKGWWEPGIEMFPIQLAASQGRSGSRAIHIRSEKNIDINVTPNTVSGAARVVKALKSAVVDLTTRLRREQQGFSASMPMNDVKAANPMDVQTSLDAKRPSVAAFCVRNETGRSMLLWLPYDSKRRPLHGNGGEIEVDTPSEELLWTAIGANGFLSTNPNKNRQISLSCILCLSGFIAKTFSTAQTGTWLVTLKPDMREITSPMSGIQPDLTPVTLVWSVAMRDGVPCGCIRSVLRLVNRTRTVLEVNLGGLRKSTSVGGAMKVGGSSSSTHSNEPEFQREHEPHGLVKAGESWSIPIHAVEKAIRIRPAIFHAPDGDLTSDNDFTDCHMKGRVFYTYKWSDPLSKISALHEIGRDLQLADNSMGESASRASEISKVSGPVLSCQADDRRHVFSMTLLPKVQTGIKTEGGDKTIPGWIDVHIRAPLIFENLLPRPIYFKLSLPKNKMKLRQEQVMAECFVEPMREAHVHTVGSNLSNVAIAIAVDNSPVHEGSTRDMSRLALSKTVGGFLPGLSSQKAVSMGVGQYRPFTLNFDHMNKVNSRRIGVFCKFWIRNRSDVDLYFRDRDANRESKEQSGPKVFLRGRPPGMKADKFVCFSGKWLNFQHAGAREDIWVNVVTEVSEIDKPVHVKLGGFSLLIDVRPAKGKFQRSLVVTIRNAVWMENRTGTMLQWCQPAALNAHGIALTSRVHSVKPGEISPIHWDFPSRKRAICLRRSNDDGSSEWIWSRPVNVGIEGEYVAKMYRPKRHEQYIARIMISKLRYGVRGVVIHREDRNTPPYRIVNQSSARSIAFRQSWVHETHPWLVRPGKSTRYSWDDPQAPVKKRSLVVEVIENVAARKDSKDSSMSKSTSTSELDENLLNPVDTQPRKQKEVRYPKFDLNIDLITNHVPFANSNRFNPPLIVSVHVDGPTKVVTFSDGILGEISPRHNLRRERHVTESNALSKEENGFLSNVKYSRSLDVELFVNALGISFVESTPTELAYLSVTGIHFRLDRFDGQQLVTCEVQDLQLDNQVVRCPWPVVLWSPPPPTEPEPSSSTSSATPRKVLPKPLFQLTVDGPFPAVVQGIGNFRGIFVALQQLEIAADEDFVLRVWLFVASLIEAAGGSNEDKEEALNGKDDVELGISLTSNEESNTSEMEALVTPEARASRSLKRLYIEHLELCPLKLSVSFTSSRTSTAAERIGGFRSLIRTLLAVLGNVENAEFRFNALQLHHMFDSVSHFRSLITEFYVSQGSNQKMVLLASNSLIGNPSALFDSIAIGTRDFFVEPANAKGSADFIASIGRGSSSLLTNTVGGLVGSIGGIPKAMAQGLETAVGDRDYLAERDSIRGGRARIVSSPAQGLVTGALSFGHGIASAAAGLIRDPIQGAAEDGASGFIKGLGKGFIGGVLKPITGALDLIAEPAAGFRSMMVSDRNKECADPVRPPRAFWGAHGDQMTSYDLRAALGQAILEAVNGGDNSAENTERLMSWTHLVAVHHSANDDQVVSFLWALMRRSSQQASHFQAKYLLDAQGNPQRAEKMRAGLISTKRLIITSLDGHVLWEYPIVDIVDTQVSLEAKDYLMVGVRPIGYNSRTACAPNWKKIHCGSMAARNEMNTSLRKAIQEERMTFDNLIGAPIIDGRTGGKSGFSMTTKEKQGLQEYQTDSSVVEMIDLSNAGGMNDDGNGGGVEMKSLNHDTSVDGKRGVFTNLKLPGREEDDDTKAVSDDGQFSKRRSSTGTQQPKQDTEEDLSKKIAKAMKRVSQGKNSSLIRSVRIFMSNELEEDILVVKMHMESGQWVLAPPPVIKSKSVVILEAECGNDRVRDILGWFQLSRGPSLSKNIDELCTVRFLNPMLAANAYAISRTSWMNGVFKGGEKGDNVMTTLTLKRNVENGSRGTDDFGKGMKRKKSHVEPLLFGRSKISPFPLTIDPPHVQREENFGITDQRLIEKLSSLGFSENDAREALLKSGGDVSLAYARLVELKSPGVVGREA